MTAAKVLRAAVLALAVMRATRFFTTDTLGEWAIVGPAKRWAGRAEEAEFRRRVQIEEERAQGSVSATWATRDGRQVGAAEFVMETYDEGEPWTWQGKAVKGFDCPFCVGFWLGALALLGEATLGRIPGLGAVWRFGVSAFALNYVTGHVGSRLDG